MLQLFQEFVTPHQKKLAAMVETMGGEIALKDERTMKELLREESALTTSRSPKSWSEVDLDELQQEIKGDPNEAIEKNAELFNRKFDIQRRQIVEDIARAISQEGDRIILAMEMGPHARIVDPVLCPVFSFQTRSSPLTFRTSGCSGRKW